MLTDAFGSMDEHSQNCTVRRQAVLSRLACWNLQQVCRKSEWSL